ncbi:ABC transporter permease [Microbacterium halotolerans]|uniref:ABC transporter permease n=1 Tax=Microbacterium halotolerans TaxID=246613 RepID=UPI000E6A9E9C|nr:ABC transporter permease [Microbacterium halotolerans]
MTSSTLPDRGTARSAIRWFVHGIGSLGGVVVVLLLAELSTRTDLLPSRFLPPPTETFATLFELLGGATAWIAIAETLRSWALGLLIAVLAGVLLGLVVGANELAYRATRPIVEFLRPVPSVALIPLVFLLFADNLSGGTVFLAAFASLWPMLVQTTYGIRNVMPTQVDTARSFQIRRMDVALRVVLPSAIPYIATGVRIASTVALILVLTGEIVVGAGGIGQQINEARQGSAVAAMYAYVLLAGILGVILNALFAAVERRMLRWHPSHREASE